MELLTQQIQDLHKKRLMFFQDSRNLKDPDPPSCHVVSHVTVVQSISQRVDGPPIFENFLRRDISGSPLSDTSSGYFEAVASDSERASGGAKVPEQRRPIDFERFVCVRKACVLR